MIAIFTLLLAAGVYFWLNGRKFRREGQASVRFPILYAGASDDGVNRSLRANFDEMKLLAKGLGTAGESRAVYRLRRQEGPRWECREEPDSSERPWKDVEEALGELLLAMPDEGQRRDPEGGNMPRAEIASKLETAYQLFLRHNDPAITFPDAARWFES
jgi:hypothetical protein